jgi:hypothetical protein
MTTTNGYAHKSEAQHIADILYWKECVDQYSRTNCCVAALYLADILCILRLVYIVFLLIDLIYVFSYGLQSTTYMVNNMYTHQHARMTL